MAKTNPQERKGNALPPALDPGAPDDPAADGRAPLRAGVDRLPPPEMEYATVPELDAQGKERKDRQGNPMHRQVCTNYPMVLYALEGPRLSTGETLPNVRVVNTPEEYAAAEEDGFAQLHELVPDPLDVRGRSMMRDPATAAVIHKKRKAILDQSRAPDPIPDATVSAAQALVKGLAKIAQG